MSDKKPENEEELKKNPIWMLSPMEEKALLKEHQAWAEKQCEKQYDAFALCCKSFTWSFPWKCNGPKQDLIDCVGEKGSPAMFQKLREEYIDKKIEKKRKEEAEAAAAAGK
ncbi:similar to Saccharomyces cerevisiae YKL137W CMC1 Evolutionarily conserved copper-binding protein of the mitochondrial intermembrane space [Geotrichum candidum]|uniref:COX assembly mitochondrial protein n=1 Tax=Geotrichum candidum TaxID=1173061 RepID=A0A0J9XF00_GEOCN|nr:similar to Saccharomyces cerevisiae YKL137W CMC1 Evolutionarily conserved copper-binding protein of the mitochondrial intermembrane space [Geotrichum candidum]